MVLLWRMLWLRDKLQGDTGVLLVLKWYLVGAALIWPAVASSEDTLGICYRADAAPFSYIGDDEKPTGYTVDLCKRVASSLGVEPKLVEVTSRNRFDVLRTGSCDMLCEASTVTMERREIVEFSLITFLTGSALLYPSALLNASQSGISIKVGYLRGTTVEDQRRAGTLIGGDKAKFEFIALNSHEDAAKDLYSGELQSYIADREILDLLLQNNPKLAETHRVSNKSITYEPYAIAVRFGEDKLRVAIDRVLAELFRSKEIEDVLGVHIPNRSHDPLLKQLFEIQSLPE